MRVGHPVQEQKGRDLYAQNLCIRHVQQVIYVRMRLEQFIANAYFLGFVFYFLIYSCNGQCLGIGALCAGMLFPCVDQETDRGICLQIPEFCGLPACDHIDFTAVIIRYIGHKRAMGVVI